ncbi:hypothetical protein RB598_009475 [Gaeumannomyces tritici]
MQSTLPSPARLALAALALLSAANASLQPITPPTGPFHVGVSKHVIPFVNPDDPFAPGNVTTSYLATVYYPTLDKPLCPPPVPYLHPDTARIYGGHYGLPLDKLSALTAPALRWGATPAPAAAVAGLTGRNYSTLIWGPGGLGPATEAYTALLSDLASRGYAAVGIDHPYEQPFVWYPNPALPGGGGPWHPGPGLVGTPTDLQPTEAEILQLYAVRLREMLHFTEAGWPALVAQQGWPFATTGMGVAGHSFGGALALDVAGKTGAGPTAAAMNLDGLIYEPAQDARKPQVLFGSYLHVAGDDPAEADVSWSRYSRAQTGWWRRTLVNDYGHSDCSDVALWKELGPNKISNFSVGGILGERAVEITRGFVGAFFDRFVRGIADKKGVLDNPGKVYKEVDLLGSSDRNSSTTA